MIPIEWPAVANHLWQSTFFAGAAMLLTLVLRRNRAQLRYWLWLAASVKFLIPFSVLVSLGGQLEWHSVPAVAPAVSAAIEQVALPFDDRLVAVPVPSRGEGIGFAEWPAAVWLCGCAVLLRRWWVRWRSVRTVLRSASPLRIGAPIRVVSAASRLEPGVFGVFRPVLLLPDGIAGRLTGAQLQAILAHELSHVRRRDNLTAALHMVTEAIFWFHPLVWWIGARMVEERERACDEDVLRQGSEPGVYAAGILGVCRFYLESPLVCASGVTGADLKKRIEEIMTRRMLMKLTFWRKVVVATAGVAALAGPIAIGILHAQTALRFEVASIKPFQGGGGRGGMHVLPGGGLQMEGVTLDGLIHFAYGVRPSQVTGGESWVRNEAYQLLAKPERSDASDNPSTIVAPGTTAWHRLELRLQTLLEERFQLKIHKTVKEESGYVLVPAKGGSKLQPSPAEDKRPPGTMRGMGVINGRNGSMHMLVSVLSNMLGRPVEDRTGLTGTYTYKLEYRQESSFPGRGAPEETAPSDISGPSIYTALQEQLGLKLENAKVKVETIVIDHAARPSAN